LVVGGSVMPGQGERVPLQRTVLVQGQVHPVDDGVAPGQPADVENGVGELYEIRGRRTGLERGRGR